MKLNLRHGGGGSEMEKLIRSLLPQLHGVGEGEVPLRWLEDASVVGGVALTIDSYTVRPIFFPGGDLGRLSVCGTVNDLSVMGAEPRALAISLVAEEGLDSDVLDAVFASAGDAAREAGVPVIAGDTKVVERGGVESLIITTSGFGLEHPSLEENFRSRGRESKWLVARNLRPGDAIIVTGSVGDHGAAIVASREGLGFSGELRSDVAPLNSLMGRALEAGGVVSARDPTRGAVAGVLNEWASATGLGIELWEDKIPVREPVRALSNVLGIDPLELPNEGMAVLAVVPDRAEDVLEAVREDPRGREATVVGEVTKEHGYVVLNTTIGGRRIVERPVGDPVPRIC